MNFVRVAFAKKNAPDVLASLPNFSSNPDQFGNQDYAGVDLAQRFSPLFQLPLTIDRVQHDVAHSQLLGTGKATNGAFEKHFYMYVFHFYWQFLAPKKPVVHKSVSVQLAGSVLIYLAEAGWFGSMVGPGEYKVRLAPILRRAHRRFLVWKKMHKKQCSQPRFTPARLNRSLQTSPWTCSDRH